MPNRSDKSEVRGQSAPASDPAGRKPKQEVKATANRDNVTGKTHNSKTRKDEASATNHD